MAKATKDDMNLKISLIREGLKQHKTLYEIEQDIVNNHLVMGELVDFMKRPDIIKNFKDFTFRRRA